MGKKNIFIDSCETRFGNQLYPIACALTLYGKYPNEFNKPLFKTAGQPKYCLDLLNKFFSDNINYDRTVFRLTSGFKQRFIKFIRIFTI